MDPTIIVAIISVSFAGISGLTQVIFHNMIQSRCLKLSCCGCFCTRDPMDKDELEVVNKDDN